MAQPINNEYEKELDRTGLELVALASDKQAIEDVSMFCGKPPTAENQDVETPKRASGPVLD